MIGFWHGTETNSLANQTWDQHISENTNALFSHLVSKHRVKLIEHVFAESRPMDRDSTTTPTNVTRCHVRHDGRAEAGG